MQIINKKNGKPKFPVKPFIKKASILMLIYVPVEFIDRRSESEDFVNLEVISAVVAVVESIFCKRKPIAVESEHAADFPYLFGTYTGRGTSLLCYRHFCACIRGSIYHLSQIVEILIHHDVATVWIVGLYITLTAIVTAVWLLVACHLVCDVPIELVNR